MRGNDSEMTPRGVKFTRGPPHDFSSKFYSWQIQLKMGNSSVQFSSVQLLIRVWLFLTSWTAAHQSSQSITNSWSLLKLMSIKLVMPSNYLTLCYPLLLLPLIFPSIKVFSNKSVLHIRWSKYWTSPSNEYSGLQHQFFWWIFSGDFL